MSKKGTYILCAVIGIPLTLLALASGWIETITGHSGSIFLNFTVLLLFFGIITTAVVVITQRKLSKDELVRTAAFGFLWALLTMLIGAALVALLMYATFNNSHWAFG